ncbi:major facilitator superfamily domain-containing protein [Poronia punctata]|nr:major facilitator superfamily domain-containing protein [Poronia punctata]
MSGYALVFFMPTILVEFGWEAREAQVHSIPVYAVTAVAMVLVAYLSDRSRHRYGFIMFGCVLATVGLGMLLGQASLSRDAKYGALFLISIGGYVATPMCLVWLSNNISGHWKRAFGAGIQVTIGNIVGVVAPNVFIGSEAPYYRTGYGTTLGFTWLAGIAATAMYVGLRRENRMRDRGKRDYMLSLPKHEVNNLGDDHPSFRFTY